MAVHVVAVIKAWPFSSAEAPVDWTCPHRHKDHDTAAECAGQEMRREFVPPSDRYRRVPRKWRTIYSTTEERGTA